MGIDHFTPVINPPEAAILGVGGISLRPVRGKDGEFTPAECITLSLTIDHQAVDGAPAARFLKDFPSINHSPFQIRHNYNLRQMNSRIHSVIPCEGNPYPDDQPNDQPFRYGVCRNSLAFLLSNSNLSAFHFSFTPGVRWAATPRSTISVS